MTSCAGGAPAEEVRGNLAGLLALHHFNCGSNVAFIKVLDWGNRFWRGKQKKTTVILNARNQFCFKFIQIFLIKFLTILGRSWYRLCRSSSLSHSDNWLSAALKAKSNRCSDKQKHHLFSLEKQRHRVALAAAWPLIIDGPFADNLNCTICLTITFLTSFRLGDNITHVGAKGVESKEKKEGWGL